MHGDNIYTLSPLDRAKHKIISFELANNFRYTTHKKKLHALQYVYAIRQFISRGKHNSNTRTSTVHCDEKHDANDVKVHYDERNDASDAT
jgi:hypothetical protein